MLTRFSLHSSRNHQFDHFLQNTAMRCWVYFPSVLPCCQRRQKWPTLTQSWEDQVQFQVALKSTLDLVKFNIFIHISQFKPNFTISAKFHNFGQISQFLTKFHKFNQISEFQPNFRISAKFQNLDQIFGQISHVWPNFRILTKFQNLD